MQSGRITGTTREIGKAQGYIGLCLRDEVIEEAVNGPLTPCMRSAWIPTPEEIAAIAAGAPVILTILGTDHPPVMVSVGEAPTT